MTSHQDANNCSCSSIIQLLIINFISILSLGFDLFSFLMVTIRNYQTFSSNMAKAFYILYYTIFENLYL